MLGLSFATFFGTCIAVAWGVALVAVITFIIVRAIRRK